MDDFNEVVELLRKPRPILFVVLGTGCSYLHDQSEFEIIIPPIGSEVRLSLYSEHSYTVESITIDSDDIVVRLAQNS